MISYASMAPGKKKKKFKLSSHFTNNQTLACTSAVPPCHLVKKTTTTTCLHISHTIKPWLVQSGQICSLLFRFFFSHQGFLDKKPPVITVHFMYSGQYISLGFVHFRQLCGLFHHGLLVKRSTCHHSLFSIQLYRLRCRTSPTQRI